MRKKKSEGIIVGEDQHYIYRQSGFDNENHTVTITREEKPKPPLGFAKGMKYDERFSVDVFSETREEEGIVEVRIKDEEEGVMWSYDYRNGKFNDELDNRLEYTTYGCEEGLRKDYMNNYKGMMEGLVEWAVHRWDVQKYIDRLKQIITDRMQLRNMLFSVGADGEALQELDVEISQAIDLIEDLAKHKELIIRFIS